MDARLIGQGPTGHVGWLSIRKNNGQNRLKYFNNLHIIEFITI